MAENDTRFDQQSRQQQDLAARSSDRSLHGIVFPGIHVPAFERHEVTDLLAQCGEHGTAVHLGRRRAHEQRHRERSCGLGDGDEVVEQPLAVHGLHCEFQPRLGIDDKHGTLGRSQ